MCLRACRSLLMFTMENALIVALSQACRYLRDPGLDPRVKQFLKRELGSELVSIGSEQNIWYLSDKYLPVLSCGHLESLVSLIYRNVYSICQDTW